MSEAYDRLRTEVAARWESRQQPARTLLRVDLTTSSVAAGADALLTALRRIVRERGIDCEIIAAGSFGPSFALPTIDVHRPGRAPVLYGPVPEAELGAFVAAVLERDEPGERWALGVRAEAGERGLAPLREHPFWRPQTPRLTRWYGVLDPEAIEDAIGAGAYAALDSALTMAPAAICDLVEAAGLGGRGGAAFPAGRKWKFLLGAPGPVKYLLCNADEGDPGAFVNRILMESDPHSLIEGMLIAARATEASHGVIYIRDEYPLSVARVETALAQARAAGLLGEDILGSGWNFDLAVARGAGSYVCGEETGLIASLAGVRGMPTIRPPFPAQRGLFGRPSNVNNVETYANVPPILRHGAEWYRQHGTASDPGTKLFSISGHLQRPGVLEVAFGLPLSTLLLDAGGGCGPGHTPKGVQPGGPLSGLLPAADLDLPLERPPFTERSLLLGSGGLILFDERTCALDLALYLSEFCEDESCGRCTTCHGGSQRLVEILARIARGAGGEADLARIEALDRTLQNANCIHGQFTPYPARSLVRFFGDELREHVRERRCRARVCPGLIRHRVTEPADPALPEAAAICPTGAIVTAEAGRYRIDDGRCIQCGACREVAPAAVVVEERSGAAIPVAAV